MEGPIIVSESPLERARAASSRKSEPSCAPGYKKAKRPLYVEEGRACTTPYTAPQCPDFRFPSATMWLSCSLVELSTPAEQTR